MREARMMRFGLVAAGILMLSPSIGRAASPACEAAQKYLAVWSDVTKLDDLDLIVNFQRYKGDFGGNVGVGRQGATAGERRTQLRRHIAATWNQDLDPAARPRGWTDLRFTTLSETDRGSVRCEVEWKMAGKTWNADGDPVTFEEATSTDNRVHGRTTIQVDSSGRIVKEDTTVLNEEEVLAELGY